MKKALVCVSLVIMSSTALYAQQFPEDFQMHLSRVKQAWQNGEDVPQEDLRKVLQTIDGMGKVIPTMLQTIIEAIDTQNTRLNTLENRFE